MERENFLARAQHSLTKGAILPAAAADLLQAEAGLADSDALMTALLPVAQTMARAPISHFHVGAVGRAQETGDLLLGANVEFPSGVPGDTIHAEQFLFSRAFHLGLTIERMAVSARPCGHCRQFMNEFAGGAGLAILDPEFGPLDLTDLLPLGFGPRDLGRPWAERRWRFALEPAEDLGLTEPVALDALITAGELSHTPYSGAPTAVALRLSGGTVITGSAIESAAYNPGLPPLQAALINLLAEGHSYGAIESGLIGALENGTFCYAAPTARLLSIIAPGALLERVSWRRRTSS